MSNLDKLNDYLDDHKNNKLKINPKDLNEAFMVQAQMYQEVAIRFEKAQRIVTNQKIIYDKLKAKKGFVLRQGEKKTTEKFIEESLNKDPDIIKQKTVLAGAEYQAGCYKHLLKSWEHKRDMLIQLGSYWRAEFNARVQINKDDLEDVGPRKNSSAMANKFKSGFDEELING